MEALQFFFVGQDVEMEKEIYIALVDDNPAVNVENRHKLMRVFTDSSFCDVDFIIHDFESGVQFLETKQEYDLVLMDYEMPGMNGIETAEVLQKRTLKTKVLFLSGYSNPVEPLKQSSFIKTSIGYLFKDDPSQEFQYQILQVIKNILDVEYIEIDHFDLKKNMDTQKDEKIWHRTIVDLKRVIKLISDDKTIYLDMDDEEQFATDITLEKWYSDKLNNDFSYANKSCIINHKYVKTITKTVVVLVTDEIIKLSVVHRDKFKKNYNDYLWREGLK